MRAERLQFLILQFALQLLILGDLADGLVEIVLVDGVALVLDGRQPRLGNDVAQIGAVELIAHLDHGLEVDLALGHDAAGVDLEDLQPPDLVGQRDLDLAVQPAGAEEGWVEGVRAVGRHDDLGLAEVVEAVELVEQFHQGSLDLAVGRGAFAEAAAADGVDLVHEDDARFVLLGVAEHFADQSRRFADVFVDDGGGDDCGRDLVSEDDWKECLVFCFTLEEVCF